MSDKLLLTFYLAAAIEHNKTVLDGEKEDHKAKIKEELAISGVGIYDPVDREAQKTGKDSGNHVSYVTGLKKGGYWSKFIDEMRKIWWGQIHPQGRKVEILSTLRNKFLINGNTKSDLDYWGDEEAVIRSDFIIAYMEKNVKTTGTIREIHDCYLFDIPVYLILPDQTKSDANSTLLEMIMGSKGEIFYSTHDCIKFIKEKYKIWK